MKANSSKKSKPEKSPNHGSVSADNEHTLLGQILVELGCITIYQLDESLRAQKSDKVPGEEQKPLGQILLELGYCGPNQLIRAIQVQSEYRKTAAARVQENR